jgi:hypothetical protein
MLIKAQNTHDERIRNEACYSAMAAQPLCA